MKEEIIRLSSFFDFFSYALLREREIKRGERRKEEGASGFIYRESLRASNFLDVETS